MEAKKIFLRREFASVRSTMKYGSLVVFKRHDSAEIWWFRFGLVLGFGTLKVMASTGVFVHVVRTLKQSISGFSTTPSTILT